MRLNKSATGTAWRLAVMSVTFLCGLSVTASLMSFGEPAMPHPHDTILTVAPNASQTASQENDIPPPPPRPAGDVGQSSTPEGSWRISAPFISPLAVSPSRLLVTDGSTVYMLDAKGRVVWQWAGGESFGEGFITDQPVRIGDTIYVVGRELTYAALDVATGAVKQAWGSPYGAHFSQIEKYKDGQYLAVVDLSGVGCTNTVCSDDDMLQVYKGGEMQWQVEFPRGAQLLLRGGKIYALIYRGESVEMREIEPPQIVVLDHCC